MYLKALTLRGFKSFATATTLKFEPGITCIVGPNGSGKSNVVDALTWVMGEQGAKSLRGAAMVDVIFAGTAARQALGRAQVELTIDNSDGRLPIDFSEVTMSRTLFRGGASEYSINQSPARLLDVQELLSDTGMGRQMHVIVGQGQLDAVLNATAQERRAFIDEAAGVLKHRRRKERALRKLETMDQNLVRVLDLTEEMRRQLKPLARQAKAAQRASGVQARIIYAQRRLAVLELTEVMAALQRSHGEAANLRGRATRFDSQIEQLRAELAELGEQLEAQRRNSEMLSENWHGLRETVQRFASLTDLAKERLRRAGTVTVPISEASIELARERQAECTKEVEAAESSQQAAAKVCQEAEQQARQAADVAKAQAAKLRLAEQELNRLLDQQTKFEAELARARSQVQSSQEAVERYQKRLQEATDRAVEAASARSGAQPAAEQNLDVQVEVQVREHAQAVENENQQRQEVERLTAELRVAGEKVATWRARSQVLSESLAEPADSNRANTAGATDAAQRRQAGELRPTWNVLGQLGECVLVAKGWEDALAALLEPYGEAELIESLEVSTQIEQLSQATSKSVHALVVDGNSATENLESWRNKTLPSRGLVVGQVEPADQRVSDEQDEEQASQNPAALLVSPALEFVTANPLVAPILSVLLENTFLAESAETAVAWLQKRTNPLARVATKAGSVLTAHSIRTRGEEGVSRLRLRAELEEAKKQTQIASEDLRKREMQLSIAKDQLQAAAATAAAKLRLLRELDAKKSEQAKELARVSALALAAEQEAERAKIQLEEAQGALQAAKQLEADLEQVSVSRKKVVPETFLVEVRENSRRADEAANQWRDKLTEARMQLHGADEKLASARRQVQAFRTQIEQLLSDRERQLQKFQAANTMKLTATKVLERAGEAMESAKNLAEQAGKERQLANQKVTGTSQRVGVVQAQIANLESRRAQLVEERQQAEVEFAQLRYKFEQAKEKAWEVVPEREALTEGEAEENPGEAKANRYATNELADKQIEGFPPENRVGESNPEKNQLIGAQLDYSTVQLAKNQKQLASAELNSSKDDDEIADFLALPTELVELVQEFGPEHFWPVTGNPDTVDENSENSAERQWVPFSREIAVEALSVAERELARLGVVNPLAIEEHDALKSRHDFLMEQVEDLNRSKADLMKIIREVDQRVRESFQQAFADVSEQFAHVFSVLFPGGSGRLELTDPDDPLHTGVEIHARPAGKKVTRMSLLSGGERSLASLAYLFAIFKARPSPFYVLDEIEAALDDINLSRVLEVLQELQKDSQLLIVTHQKRTMQIADALYGITMKDGVTTAISHRMRESD